MFRPGLIVPPKLQRDISRDRRVTWLELFFDLIYVVAIGRVSVALEQGHDWAAVAKTAVIFVAVWWAWVGQTFYLARFDSDDLIHRIVTMIQMFAVAAMAIAIPHAVAEGSSTFVIAYCCVRLVLILEYFRAAYHIPESRPLALHYGLGFTLAAGIWLASLAFEPSIRCLVWIVALFVDYGTPLTARGIAQRFPPHLTHLPERFGLFTLIVIGESVAGVVLGLQSGGLSSTAILCGALAWIGAFSIWWCYFDGIRGAEARGMGNRLEARQFQRWMYYHLPLTFGIVVAAVEVNRGVAMTDGASFTLLEGWVFVAGSWIAMTAMNLISRTDPLYLCDDSIKKYLIPHNVVCAIAPFAGLLTPFLPAYGLIGVVTLLWLAHVVLTLRVRPGGEEGPEIAG